MSRDVDLEPSALSLDEVLVEARVMGYFLRQPVIGVEVGKMETIKRLPGLLGETDVVQSMLSLPGVQSVGEGALLKLTVLRRPRQIGETRMDSDLNRACLC